MSIATEITRLQTAKADLKTAIEGKGVTVPSATLIDGYADLVDSISGGGGGTTIEDAFISGSGFPSIYTNNRVTVIRSYAFNSVNGIQKLSLPSVTNINADYALYSGVFEEIELPNLATISRGGIFRYCGALKKLFLPALTSLPSQGDIFANCTSLKTVVLPLLEQGNTGGGNFNGDTVLEAVDIGGNVGSIGSSNAFLNCKALETVVLRGNVVAACGNINNFNNSPFASGKAGGTLYVPQSLISSYQAATNWSTILGYSTNSIAAIEGSQYENYYADGTPISA